MDSKRVLGIDATKGANWVGVVIHDNGFLDIKVGPLLELTEWSAPVDAIGIDIPILDSRPGPRAADLAARAFVGPRRSSVFAAPPLDALTHETLASANQSLHSSGRPKMSAQSWALIPKIIEARPLAEDPRVIEVHPEVSFRALATEPLRWPKKTWNGQHQRRHLLATADIELPNELGAAGLAPVDDILDAAVAAWSALRYANGNARSLPDTDETPRTASRRTAIWY